MTLVLYCNTDIQWAEKRKREGKVKGQSTLPLVSASDR